MRIHDSYGGGEMACILVNNRALLLGATDIDWDNLGGQKKAVISDDGTNVFLNGAVSVRVFHMWRNTTQSGQKGDSLMLRHQTVTDPALSKFRDWPGNFAPLAALLWTDRLDPHDGFIDIVFNDHVNGPTVEAAGVQIQTLDKGALNGQGEFTAFVRAFDLNGALLGEFSSSCSYSNAGDDSATFIGVTGGGISRIEFSVGDPKTGEFYPNGFVVNRTFTE